VDGHRGDIIILKTAKTMAAYNGRTEALKEDVDAAAELALPHRIRRQPLQDIVLDVSELRRRNQMRREASV
jgi:magnesium chelatase subunit I